MSTRKQGRRFEEPDSWTTILDWLMGTNRIRASKMRLRLVLIGTTCLLVVFIVFNTHGGLDIHDVDTGRLAKRRPQSYQKKEQGTRERPVLETREIELHYRHGYAMGAPPGPRREALREATQRHKTAPKGSMGVGEQSNEFMPPNQPPSGAQVEEAQRPPPPGPPEQPHQRLRVVESAPKGPKMVGPLGQSNTLGLHLINKDAAVMPDSHTVQNNGKGARGRPASPGGRRPPQSGLQRLVQLDLRVGPPKVTYLEQIFPLLSQWGATGVLIDYGENFPYSGPLARIASPKAYTQKDISRIVNSAKVNNLDIIPLVQTFLEHKELQFLEERENFPQNLNPATNETQKFITYMLDQVIELHPGISYVHIGCEEVYHLGNSAESKVHLSRTPAHDASDLYVYYVMTVASLVRSRHPGIRVMVWDNVLRSMETHVLQRSGLGDLVEPVVSMYHHTGAELPISTHIWSKYAQIFPNLWVGSFFNRPSPTISLEQSVFQYINNQKAWLSMMSRVRNTVNIRGVAMLGVYKSSHFSSIGSVLLPMALPTLGLCLRTIVRGTLDLVTLRDVMMSFECSRKEREDIYLEGTRSVFLSCRFPGNELYQNFVELRGLVVLMKNKGLPGPNNYTLLAEKFAMLLRTMPQHLDQTYDQDTAIEWLTTHLLQNLGPLESFQARSKTFLLSKKWVPKPQKKSPSS